MLSTILRHAAFCAAILLPIDAAAQTPAAVDAIRIAGDDGFDAAYAAVPAGDAVTRDVLTWLRLREDGQPFDDYAPFLDARADWPRLDRLRAKGELAMPATLPPQDIIAWFGDANPQTGQGAVKLARALIASGQTDAAEAMLVEVWLTETLSDSSHAAMLSAFPDVLEPHHLARADAMLWRWRTSDAERMIDLLGEDEAKLVAARIALIRKAGTATQKVAAVPPALRDDPGLLYDRYNLLAETGRRTEAVAILRAQSTSADALGEPFRWSGWRRTLARWEMREGDPTLAYALAKNHFLTADDGSAFTDLEWLAGYLALTYLDDPVLALAHFRTGFDAVETPISVSRMGYWTGRALEALGETVEAREAYGIAAQHQTAFYGLLAAEKLGLGLDPRLTGAEDARDWAGSAALRDETVRAALVLAGAGRRGDAIPFFVAAAERLPQDELSRLGAYLASKDETFYEVLLGKSAVNEGILVPSLYFPIHPLAEMDLPVDPALALAIARRESEFFAAAGSPVGAQGLMQLMPATAREVAGFEGIAYSKPRLTSDWRYNARLGARYLAELEATFGNSPVMIAAGYNAGPSRPKTWMSERGDPRAGEIDIVDWIEHIPFRETRNYVMRVTESLPVYRARLRGELGPVRFTQLLIGEKPVIRPTPRPEREGVVSTTSVSAPPSAPRVDDPNTRVVARPALDGDDPVGLRPLARPEG